MKFDLKLSDLMRQTFSSILSRKKIISKAGIMAGARVMAMIFGAVGSIYAARCLGPRNLGISGMVQNIVAQATVLLGFIYSTVLVREYKNARTEEAKNQLIRVSTTFRFIGALIFSFMGLIMMIFQIVPSDFRLAGWFFMPLLFLGIIQPAWVFQAAEKQHFQSIISVLQPAMTAGLYLCFFRSGMSAWADLAVISTITMVLTVIYWWAIYRFTPMKGNIFDFQGFQEAKDLFLKSRWLFISSLAIYVYAFLDQPLLGWLYSVEELGKYRTAVTVVNAANSFFVIIPTILYPRFIEWQKLGDEILWRRQLKLAAFFSVFGGVIIILVFILVPILYPLIFGSAFVKAAIPCEILITSKIVSLITGIFYCGLLIDNKHDRYLTLAMIGIAVYSFLLNVVLIPKWGMYSASITYLTSEIILLVICVWASLVKSKIKKLKKLTVLS